MKKQKITSMTFTDDGSIPNNEKLPVLLYSAVFANEPEACQDTFHHNNWKNSWRGDVLDYHHYHSDSHEVLGVLKGSVRIKLGGKKGTAFDLEAGDVIVLPAGTGHKKMSSSFDFRMTGAYPNGSNYNLKTGERKERPEVMEDIKNVPLPKFDPVFGKDGPLIKKWIEEK
ncbi:cupin domain-containing protein [Alteribacillus bidgolensis]|uniref:Uncharacterized protein YjlB n=1 Tax=Alteribacillus bidgolensis TaxID=930129 RepID=A0A1G8CI69_9BACI|nr:cupin domain-containing protein [Alteribacillus bidgolensis]SDH45137.1 Uncharacterized protein YjlB [Alteribacillus bidgolensis]